MDTEEINKQWLVLKVLYWPVQDYYRDFQISPKLDNALIFSSTTVLRSVFLVFANINSSKSHSIYLDYGYSFYYDMTVLLGAFHIPATTAAL